MIKAHLQESLQGIRDVSTQLLSTKDKSSRAKVGKSNGKNRVAKFQKNPFTLPSSSRALALGGGEGEKKKISHNFKTIQTKTVCFS